jgi:hypothetical protein
VSRRKAFGYFLTARLKAAPTAAFEKVKGSDEIRPRIVPFPLFGLVFPVVLCVWALRLALLLLLAALALALFFPGALLAFPFALWPCFISVLKLQS